MSALVQYGTSGFNPDYLRAMAQAMGRFGIEFLHNWAQRFIDRHGEEAFRRISGTLQNILDEAHFHIQNNPFVQGATGLANFAMDAVGSIQSDSNRHAISSRTDQTSPWAIQQRGIQQQQIRGALNYFSQHRDMRIQPRSTQRDLRPTTQMQPKSESSSENGTQAETRPTEPTALTASLRTAGGGSVNSGHETQITTNIPYIPHQLPETCTWHHQYITQWVFNENPVTDTANGPTFYSLQDFYDFQLRLNHPKDFYTKLTAANNSNGSPAGDQSAYISYWKYMAAHYQYFTVLKTYVHVTLEFTGPINTDLFINQTTDVTPIGSSDAIDSPIHLLTRLHQDEKVTTVGKDYIQLKRYFQTQDQACQIRTMNSAIPKTGSETDSLYNIQTVTFHDVYTYKDLDKIMDIKTDDANKIWTLEATDTPGLPFYLVLAPRRIHRVRAGGTGDRYNTRVFLQMAWDVQWKDLKSTIKYGNYGGATLTL